MQMFVPTTYARPSRATWRSVATHASLLSQVGANNTSTPWAHMAARASGM